jgi:hypothetical protein
MKILRRFSRSLLGSMLALSAAACAATDSEHDDLGSTEAQLVQHEAPWEPSTLTPFSFESRTSTSGEFADGDVRLDAVQFGRTRLPRWALQTVKRAKILVDDGVDEARGGHNLASGQGINSALDDWTDEGPATITPTSEDLAASLGNFNLTSIVVTRENVGTASVEVTFAVPVNTLFFWERGNTNSPTTANSDLLVEALNWRGEVTASHKLLRSEYAPTGIAITTWNGSFASPSTPTGTPPQLGSVGLALDGTARRFRLTSVQQAEGGVRDDGPDYKLIGALLPRFAQPRSDP